ncbi:MAG: hypothetical protein LBG60_05590 [Bifidobacteriaceae bacterium]|nr:hypothetical protein [Bifidobacteriaceae bacterium]
MRDLHAEGDPGADLPVRVRPDRSRPVFSGWAEWSNWSFVRLEADTGLDLALWDLEAKALGVRVHRLLGGALRLGVPTHSSHHLWHNARQAHVGAAETTPL